MPFDGNAIKLLPIISNMFGNVYFTHTFGNISRLFVWYCKLLIGTSTTPKHNYIPREAERYLRQTKTFDLLIKLMEFALGIYVGIGNMAPKYIEVLPKNYKN